MFEHDSLHSLDIYNFFSEESRKTEFYSEISGGGGTAKTR